MNPKLESTAAQDHFKENKADILDVVILEMLNNEPLTRFDIECELSERGIPGYDRKTISERLDVFCELFECFKARTGYIAVTQELCDTLQFDCSFRQCRKPKGTFLKDVHYKHFHTYIEDGFDTKRSQRIPVPNGTRVFARIHYLPSSKYFTHFYSHIYAFKYKDGPTVPVDMWFYGYHPG